MVVYYIENKVSGTKMRSNDSTTSNTTANAGMYCAAAAAVSLLMISIRALNILLGVLVIIGLVMLVVRLSRCLEWM